LKHVDRHADGIAEAEGIGAAMALHGDPVQPEQDGAVVAPRIGSHSQLVELDGIYAYDPDKAASILKEAGYTKPIPLTISTSNPEGVPELLQAQLSKVGFEPTIETIPQAQFTQQVYINHEKALAVDFFAGRESPAQAFQVLFSDTGLMNPGREYDPAVKEAIEKVIATPLDDPAYAERLQEATKVAVTSMPNTFLYSRPRVVARAKAVSELTEHLTLVTWEGVTVS